MNEERARRVLDIALRGEPVDQIADETRPAVEWFLEHDRAAAARLVAALSGYWQQTGRVAEGRELSERVAQATIAEAARDPELAAAVPGALAAAAELASSNGEDVLAAKRARDAVRAAGLVEDSAALERARAALARAEERWAGFESLLSAPSPATLTTFDTRGGVTATPVWYRYGDGAFEVVIVEGDAKLANLRRDPRFILMIFEVAPPFRRVEVRGTALISEGDVTEARASISGRYLGPEAGRRFADERRDTPSALIRLSGRIRTWDLRAALEPGTTVT